ncbi:MAG: hypothetical protein WA817_06270, partial [Candidatus Acidiferrum sp.]
VTVSVEIVLLIGPRVRSRSRSPFCSLQLVPGIVDGSYPLLVFSILDGLLRRACISERCVMVSPIFREAGGLRRGILREKWRG